MFHFFISLRRELLPKSLSAYNCLSKTNIYRGNSNKNNDKDITGLYGLSKQRKKSFLARELYVRTVTTVVFRMSSYSHAR